MTPTEAAEKMREAIVKAIRAKAKEHEAAANAAGRANPYRAAQEAGRQRTTYAASCIARDTPIPGDAP